VRNQHNRKEKKTTKLVGQKEGSEVTVFARRREKQEGMHCGTLQRPRGLERETSLLGSNGMCKWKLAGFR